MGFYFTEMQKKSNGGTEQTCRLIEKNLPVGLADDFQIIPSRITDILEDKIRVYHLHDLPQDPEINHIRDANSRNRFHKLVFCGNWQYNQYLGMLGIPANDKCAVIDTPIVPIEYKEKSKDEIRLIYTSTPQRGLALLVPVFVELARHYPEVRLDVFSSFSIYGWGQADEQFKGLFDICNSHPQINYHGAQPNEVVREALQRAHIFAYPSIWQECNSRALIEAMSAGCLCIHPNLAGLGDTSGGLTNMYQFDLDPSKHASEFYSQLVNARTTIHFNNTRNKLDFVKQYADNRFNIKNIANKWTDMLIALKEEYPTVETRALPKEVWSYRTS